MKHSILKTATCCLVGTLVFSSFTLITNAAGITSIREDMTLGKSYVNAPMVKTGQDSLLTQNEKVNNLAIAKVTDYVNIRKESNEESEILGKLYAQSAATILEADGDWSKIESGSVTGYVKTEFIAVEDEAIELAKTVGKKIATVNTTTLKVRNEPKLESMVKTLVPIGEELDAMEETEGWVKVSIDSDVIGYVSSDYVTMRTEYKEAESIEEEKARLALEAKKLDTQNGNKALTATTTKSTSKRDAIVKYAMQFVGNPYVWGGTSLTQGADCSGFTQSVFRDNGISIPRTSRTQATGGKVISLDNIQSGDLIFYTSDGTINHVALYIGNGKVIGASNAASGIKISNYTYRQPYKVVSYIN